MFEDSTFESTGRIRTRSRAWMIATSTFNGAILLALILIPLIYPEALPRQALTFLLEAPAPPAPQQPPVKQTAQAFHGASEVDGRYILAPSKIPPGIAKFAGPEQPPNGSISWVPGSGVPGMDNIFHGGKATTVVHADNRGPVRVSSLVVAGLLIRKTVPPYPLIAREARIEGTVVLQATISKGGTIENLRVVGGPAMLQQAAMDAVKTWLYKPYLLDGEPVEVETTVNVVFTMGH